MDKRIISRNFSRAAASYNEHAVLQNTALERLVESLPVFRIQPSRILDLGSGTGLASKQLHQQYSRAEVIQLDIAESMLSAARKYNRRIFNRDKYVCADAEQLPIADETCDLVFSCLMMQWSLKPLLLLEETSRILKSRGLFLFATLGNETHHELRQCWNSEDKDTFHRYVNIQQLGNSLLKAGFDQPVLSSESIVLTYPDLASIFKDLKQVGAMNATEHRRRSLTGKNRYKECQLEYEKLRKADRLPLTYEVIYGHAWKQQEAENVSVPVQFMPDVKQTGR